MCIRDSRGRVHRPDAAGYVHTGQWVGGTGAGAASGRPGGCLLYTSDAADERSSVDLGGRRIIKTKNSCTTAMRRDASPKQIRQR